ncbi:TonB-dependent receptor plug domain-containing protein [Tenacibaculum sp. 190524A05c]|uniref:Plug domain-containing protein n=1 Tax=Tenacibaculum platacis TaxID=3137852 RepID=A0ABM9NRI1_9FLAO
MKPLFAILFLLCFSFCDVNAQDFKVSYDKKDLKAVIQKIEQHFEVRFSYNNSILEHQKFSYSGTIDVDLFLLEIEIQNRIASEYIDRKNIILKGKDKTNPSYILDEVQIVSEYLTSGFDQNKEDGSIILNPTQMGVLPGLVEPDVLQSLQLLPGVSSPTESATNLHIRGGTPDQNLVLWDGIKMYHQGHLFGMISAFNPYITDRVNIYRSGASAKYGNRISGIIDMHSSDDILEKTSVGVGSNLLNADAYIKLLVIKDKLGLVVSSRRSLTDVFNSITYQQLGNKVFQNTKIEDINTQTREEELTVLKDQFYFVDFNAKTTWKINDKNRINFSSLFVRNELDYANSTFEGETSNDKLDLKNSGFSLQTDHSVSQNLKLSSNINYSDYQSDNSLIETTPVDSESYNRTNSVKDFGVSFQSELSFSPSKKLLLGLEYNDYNVNSLIDFPEGSLEDEIENNSLNAINVFGEYRYTSKKWFVNSGLRVSRYGKLNKTFFEPRFYMNYNINPHFKFKSSGEIKNQAISQLITFEFNELGLHNNVWALADNDDIPILSNYQLTTGFLFDKNNWKLDIEGYYRYTEGLTTSTRGFNSNAITDSYFSGKSSAYGIDILIKKRIKRFRTWLSYSLSKTLFNFGDLQNGNFAGNFDQRHVISFSNTYKLKRFQFSLGWHFATGKPFSTPSGIGTFTNENNETESFLEYGSQNNTRLVSYHKLDGSILYDFKLGKHKNTKARIGVSFLNIYNHTNQIDRFFNINSDNSEISEERIIGLRTTPNVVFRVTF